MVYTTRYVHKISSSLRDLGPEVAVDYGPQNARTLGKALRDAGALQPGERVRDDSRVEADGRIVAFPATGIWWSIILTPKND